MEKSKPFELVAREEDYTMLIQSEPISGSRNLKKRNRAESSTLESVVPTRKKTCRDKSRTSRSNTRTMSSSKTLVQVSTSEEKGYRPFWNELSKAWSQKLWLPIKTDCVGTGSSYWNSSLSNLGQNSWFTVDQKSYQRPGNSQMTYWPSQPSLWRATMEEGPSPTDEKEGDLRTRKIRVYPTRAQKEKLQKWFGVTRWTYNQCVSAHRDKTERATKKNLRALTVNDAALTAQPWAKEVPYDIRDGGMLDFLKALESNRAKVRKGNLKNFSLGYRSIKDPQQNIVVAKKHWIHKRGIYSDVFGPGVLRSSEPLPLELEHDVRLVKDRLGKYYLCLPVANEIRSENQAPDPQLHSTISLDPGCRTFISGYDADGYLFEWGKGDMGRIQRLCSYLDRLQSRISKCPHKKRYRLKKAAARMRERIKSLVDELHKKCSTWLCRSYRVILIPVFGVKSMVKRGKRSISSRTARSLLTWSHFRFRQRLLNKAKQYPWCQVVVTEEPYTSKTCTGCGWIDTKLGGKKEFRCKECNVVMDRDSNGARNILLRHLTINKKSASVFDTGFGSRPLDEQLFACTAEL